MRIEHYIDPDSPEVHYRLVQELFAIRSEVCRRLERLWLSKAESIPRSLNDRNEFKTVRLKCDYRAEWRGRKAILALIIRRSGGVAKMDIEDLEEDCAVRRVAAIKARLGVFTLL